MSCAVDWNVTTSTAATRTAELVPIVRLLSANKLPDASIQDCNTSERVQRRNTSRTPRLRTHLRIGDVLKTQFGQVVHVLVLHVLTQQRNGRLRAIWVNLRDVASWEGNVQQRCVYYIFDQRQLPVFNPESASHDEKGFWV